MSFDARGRLRRPVHHAKGNAFAHLELAAALFARRGICLLQHDMDVANGSGATVRADLNNAIEALATTSSGATAPSTTYAYQFWADTTAGLLKQRNGANLAWIVRGTLAESFVTSRSSNTILAAADFAKPFVATASFTQTLTAAATLADGWFCYYRVNSGVTITFDPNASENIDGATTKVVVGPAAGIIFCSGSAFFTYGFDQPAASDTVAGLIEIAIQSEMEAGSDTTRAVTPGRQHYHPSAAKAWLQCNFAGAVAVSYNVTSVTDTGTGIVTVNWGTDFSGADYAVVAMAEGTSASAANLFNAQAKDSTKAAGSVEIDVWRESDANLADASRLNVIAFGDHA